MHIRHVIGASKFCTKSNSVMMMPSQYWIVVQVNFCTPFADTKKEEKKHDIAVPERITDFFSYLIRGNICFEIRKKVNC